MDRELSVFQKIKYQAWPWVHNCQTRNFKIDRRYVEIKTLTPTPPPSSARYALIMIGHSNAYAIKRWYCTWCWMTYQWQMFNFSMFLNVENIILYLLFLEYKLVMKIFFFTVYSFRLCIAWLYLRITFI